MKKYFLSLLLICISLCVQAQITRENSFLRKALVVYQLNSRGFYERGTDLMTDEIVGVETYYAYDKKAHNLYVITPTANVEVTLNNDYAKIIKKNKSIPQLKNEELQEEVRRRTQMLDSKMSAFNLRRQRYLNDSINKVKADSVAKAKREQEILAKRQAENEAYRRGHNYHFVPTNGFTLNCLVCDKSFRKDSIYTFGIKNDTIYFTLKESGDLGLTYWDTHKAVIPKLLSDNSRFRYHYDVFRDSLTSDTLDYDILAAGVGYIQLEEYEKELKRKAPYGYFDGWGWDSDYSNVSFDFTYVNTNSKTIKYITVYFRITNEVGDVRKTGFFRGTGPLKENESASWNWETSPYYVAGDASNMSITKVILTYMNGKTKVVTGRYLQFNSQD